MILVTKTSDVFVCVLISLPSIQVEQHGIVSENQY